MSDSPRYLYRHFAADGSLLHVGIANSALRRLAEHHHNSRWFPFIKHVAIEAHPNMDAARKAERRAIALENPRFNEAGRRNSFPRHYVDHHLCWVCDSRRACWGHGPANMLDIPVERCLPEVFWYCTAHKPQAAEAPPAPRPKSLFDPDYLVS